jgi:hypothetical protein
MSGISQAVWTVAILSALSVSAALTPLFIANASNECEAVEATLLPEMHTVKTLDAFDDPEAQNPAQIKSRVKS